MTIFSAPDYPQFQLPGERYSNLGAVLRLSAPDYATPAVLQFSASLPRPEVRALSAVACRCCMLRELPGKIACFGLAAVQSKDVRCRCCRSLLHSSGLKAG